MKVCPDCSTTYPDEFLFCPLVAKALLQFQTAAREAAAEARERAAGAAHEDGGERELPSSATAVSPPEDEPETAADPEIRVGATVHGRYGLERRLGGGPLGEVFEAVDLEEQSRWAFKVLRRDQLQDHLPSGRFARQAEPLTGLRHPGLAAVREVGETEDGSPFLVLELVQGTDPFELSQPVTLDKVC